MQTEPVLSTNKIIVLIVFLCAAIMTSLFIFHMRGKTDTKKIDENFGTVFSVPKDIKEINLISDDGKAFTLKNLNQHWTIMIFGFTHCSSVCPTNLALLNRIYPSLIKQFPQLQVVLISLDPERDTLKQLNHYTKSFNPAFIGVSGKIEALRKLQAQLGVFSAKEYNNSINYQIQHTASIYLINPKGQWIAVLNYGLKPNEIIKAINNSISLI